MLTLLTLLSTSWAELALPALHLGCCVALAPFPCKILGFVGCLGCSLHLIQVIFELLMLGLYASQTARALWWMPAAATLYCFFNVLYFSFVGHGDCLKPISFWFKLQRVARFDLHCLLQCVCIRQSFTISISKVLFWLCTPMPMNLKTEARKDVMRHQQSSLGKKSNCWVFCPCMQILARFKVTKGSSIRKLPSCGRLSWIAPAIMSTTS